jgi:transposase
LDERAVFKAVVYVLTSGCAWRHLPETFEVSPATAHRRFTSWTRAGLWRRLNGSAVAGLGADRDWTRAIVDAALLRTERAARRPVRPGQRAVLTRYEGRHVRRAPIHLSLYPDDDGEA